jgi:two-component system, LytTR family, sensor histidine kinase AlgZ
MPRTERRWMFSLIWINLAVTVMAPLIQMTGNRAGGWKGLLQGWAIALVYANVTGVAAVAIFPVVVEKLAPRKVPLLPLVMVSCIVFAAAGSLLAQTVLFLLDVAVPPFFWREYSRTMGAAMPLALAFGLGAFFYGSMRERLRDSQERLREKGINEERALKLAAEAKLRSLESRIHPHFLFNTLNSISSLIAVDPARAEQVVGRLATLLRSSLDNTGQPLIPLRQELAMVEDYLEIETVRFGEKFSGSVEVPADLREVKVPPLAIQSLVENAVKHGITPQKGGGALVVGASAENGLVCIEVSDSGPGFDSAAISAGHGLDNLVERLDTLFGSRAHLNIFRRDGRCVVQMVLPRV